MGLASTHSVEEVRMLLIAGVIATMMGGAFYAGVQMERAERASVSELAPLPESELEVTPDVEADVETEAEIRAEAELQAELDAEEEAEELEFNPVLSIDIDLDDDAELFPVDDDIELAGGARIGQLVFDTEAFVVEPIVAPERRRTRRLPTRPPGPRLHSDPGMHSILTARRMMSSDERIQGSCYAYLTEVYARAGHSSWRKRRIVYRRGRTGPYANLDLIRPGDWLYIVTDPSSSPVRTHSVMFVRWEDRARGYARVISHPGWFAGPHTGRESNYDVSQTYRIIRPTD